MTCLNLDREMLARGGYDVQLEQSTLHQLRLGATVEPQSKGAIFLFVVVFTHSIIVEQ